MKCNFRGQKSGMEKSAHLCLLQKLGMGGAIPHPSTYVCNDMRGEYLGYAPSLWAQNYKTVHIARHYALCVLDRASS